MSGIRDAGEDQSAAAGPSYAIRAVSRTCQILTIIARAPGSVPLADLAKATGMPRSSTYKYLATLEMHGFVQRDREAGAYRLGLGVLPLRAREAERVAVIARPYLERLRDTLGETVAVMRLDGGRLTDVDVVESHSAVRAVPVANERFYLHATASGKLIAAQLPERVVRSILRAEGMPRLTERTITDEDAFLAEVAAVRRRGYAVSNGESHSDQRSVSVPVPGWPEACVNMAAPAGRLPQNRIRSVVQELRQTAESLGADLASSRDGS